MLAFYLLFFLIFDFETIKFSPLESLYAQKKRVFLEEENTVTYTDINIKCILMKNKCD